MSGQNWTLVNLKMGKTDFTDLFTVSKCAEEGKIETHNLNIDSKEVEQLRQEVEKLREQNEELKKALLSSLNTRIYSLLGLCGFPEKRQDSDEPSED